MLIFCGYAIFFFMKIYFSFGILLFFVVFSICSCRKKVEFREKSAGKESLLSSFSENKFDWTDDVWGVPEKKANKARIPSGLQMTPELFAASLENQNKLILPYIEGFGSLDVSDLKGEASSVIKGFCSNFCAGLELESFVEEKSIETLVFFRSDVQEFFESHKKKCKDVFTDFIYGKPFISDNSFEVPVSFWNESVRLTVFVYLNQETDWKINQIQIKKWQVK